VDERVPVTASGFEKQHAIVGILAEPGRDGTPCRAGADDDVGVAIAHRLASERFDDAGVLN
jgi:hypothetical protein